MMRTLTLMAVGLLLALPLTIQASDLLPKVPLPAGKDKCVEPTDVMRREHMHFILHQRDETMHKGIRTTKHSLKECINCHNAPREDGKVAHIESKDHFCNSCHSYAAVTIDCFQCHADKPENTNYRHSLVENTLPHHPEMSGSALTKDTLNVLATKGDAK